MKNIFAHFDFCILVGTSVFFVPLFGSSLTIDPVLTPRFCVWGILSIILSLFFLIRLSFKPNTIDRSILRRMIFPAFLGYFLFSLISLTKAVNVTEGVYEVLKISLSIVYLFLATVILSRNKNYIPIIVKAVMATATILSAIGVYEYVKYGSFDYTATMANSNQLSSISYSCIK